MKVNINGKDIDLKLSVRVYIYYENITSKSFDLKDFGNFSSLVTLFYSTILASAKRKGEDFSIGYEDFLEWIDENGGEFLLADFVNWYAEQQKIQSELLRKQEDKGDEVKKKAEA